MESHGTEIMAQSKDEKKKMVLLRSVILTEEWPITARESLLP